ncbi:hypothetical protein Pint_25203 [Pistacia integerrima]|uniref:Uncharacterized protein n=1 Tax=Pistacia integerrima TaxID=434235 RepID=A0ACC0YGJ8_9ROSI|nr:hypothetical protein Pint_25203 [Pistacia integerrima]
MFSTPSRKRSAADMGIRRMLLQLTIIGCGIILAAAAEQPSLPFPIAKPGCQDKCGNVSIPYPFGTTENCFHSQHFSITCNDTYYDPPKAFLERSDIRVTKITLQGKLHILQYIASDCYDESGIRLASNRSYLYLPTFIISYTDNKFIAVGCDTKAYVAGLKEEEEYIVGCMSLCDSIDYESHNTCSGIGCCQTSIPKGVTAANVTLNSYYNHTEVWKFNPCSYAFIVEENQFNFSSTSLRDLKEVQQLPVVLDWTIGNQSCKECQGESKSRCIDSENGSGYRCECLKGYQGNPYLPGGCRDVNECEVPDLNNCEGNCVNTEGSYICLCPKGYHGDGNKSGQGCILGPSKVILVTIGVSAGLVVLVIGSSWLYWGFKRRNLILLKEKFFRQNGGFFLRQQLSRGRGEGTTTETAKIYTAEELDKATNNYDESRVVGRGGYGTVYRGTLSNGKVVAVKMSKVVDQSQIEQFINEVIVLSQINHRNVVKLLEDCVINGENLEHLNEVACLARRCVRVKGDERPTMKEVAMELEGMRITAQHPWVNNESNLEETEQLLGESLDTVSYGCGTSSSYDSMKNQVTVRVCDTR